MIQTTWTSPIRMVGLHCARRQEPTRAIYHAQHAAYQTGSRHAINSLATSVAHAPTASRAIHGIARRAAVDPLVGAIKATLQTSVSTRKD